MEDFNFVFEAILEVVEAYGKENGKFCYLNDGWFEIGSLREAELIGASDFIWISNSDLVSYVNINLKKGIQ